MFSFVLLATVLACAHVSALPESKIVGGTLATINDSPWIVALLYDINNSGIYNQACGGIIISRTTILSSAQCTYGSRAIQWRVRAGSSYHNNGGQVIQVSSFKVHENYNPQNLQNDLTLLFLANPITLSSTAMTATLPSQGAGITDNSACFVTGWGRLSAGGSAPVQLYKMTVSAVNQNQCVSAYSGFNTITSNMFCAGRLGVGGMDACQGDTGGPLMINGVLMGVNSWGRGCGEPQYPGVYTRVSMYRTWINNNS